MKHPFPYTHTTKQMKWENLKIKSCKLYMSKYYSTTENPRSGDFVSVTLCLWEESKCFKSILITLVIHKNTMAVKWSYGGLKIFPIVFEQWNSSLMEQNPIFRNILNCMPIIPVLKRSKQEDCSWVQGHPGVDSEFQANQICRVRPCLKQTKMANNNSTWQTV